MQISASFRKFVTMRHPCGHTESLGHISTKNYATVMFPRTFHRDSSVGEETKDDEWRIIWRFGASNGLIAFHSFQA